MTQDTEKFELISKINGLIRDLNNLHDTSEERFKLIKTTSEGREFDYS